MQSLLSVVALIILCLVLALPTVQAQPEPPPFFLPQNPVAAAYVLGRLSTQELMAAPRSEFVFKALLQRRGMDRKYRIEALDGLAKLHNSDRLSELLSSWRELDAKGAESEPVLRELAPWLLESLPAELAAKRSQLNELAAVAVLPLTRQVFSAGRVIGGESTDSLWSGADPTRLADLLLGFEWIQDAKIRTAFYAKVEPLLHQTNPPEVRRAAISAISAVPGHETETFKTLAGFAQQGIERAAAIGSLQRLPKQYWDRDLAESLATNLVAYLSTVPIAERTEDAFLAGARFVVELASFLPTNQAKPITRSIRQIETQIVVIRTLPEQMLFDKNLIVVEAGRPIQIILENTDAMQHNLVILAPGAAEEIGNAAEKMPADPDREGRVFVPDSPKVLQATPMLNSGERAKLNFIAPEAAGDYQYICSFPGHWRRMLGVMKVVPDLEAYESTQPELAAPVLTEWKLDDLAPDLGQVSTGRNLENGQHLFTKLGCIQCHKIAQLGNSYGPDLTGVFQRWNGDRAGVLREILEPSRVITERFRNWQFALQNGSEIVGLITEEDDDTLKIQTAPNQIKSLEKSDLQSRRMQTTSVMPLGLLATASKEQIFDLLFFLETAGTAHGEPHLP